MKDLVLLSGGLDSTTALAMMIREGTAAATLSVDYGQRHSRELAAAEQVAAHYGLPHQTLDFTGWGASLAGSALTDPGIEVPYGHYADPSMALTVVPNRNAAIIMAAAGIAWAKGLVRVVAAMHAGDHPVYPDCRPEFVTAMRRALQVGTDGRVTLHAPFVDWSKTAIAAFSSEIAAPVHLSWSCYEGGDVHCGKCGTCVERIEAFQDAGVADPTIYREVSV